MTSAFLRDRLSTVAAVLGCAVGGLAYFLILLDFRSGLTRRAVEAGFASNFFDLQARAFLDGHLWVPDGSLGIEGFIQRGHTYMYFPPFPAVARIPFLLVTDRYDGRLSLLMMALAWVLYAVMASKLLWLVRSRLTARELSLREAVAGGLFLAVATGGTVLTFDAALPWVYHEVYLWAVALVVASLYWLLRVTLDPTRDNTLWLGAFTLAAILTRTTGGFAVAITVIGVGIWHLLRATDRTRRRRGLLVVAAGLVPLAASIAFNWAKFRHPYLFPLEDQVWTQVNAHRRHALEANGGTITGPQFLSTTFYNYFRPDGVRFTSWFPWISLPAEPAQARGGAVVDQAYRTGSVTAFNPLLLGLSVIALAVIVRRLREPGVRALIPLAVAAGGVGGGVMMYGYLTMRYTSEFVPGLLGGGAIGLWALAPRLAAASRKAWYPAIAAMVVLVGWSVLAHMATAHTASVTTARGERLKDYIATQLRWSDGDPTRLPAVRDVPGPPTGGTADEFAVHGNCEALYVNSGDQYDPWILVEQRPIAITVEAGPEVRPGTVTLFDITADQTRHIVMEIDDDLNALVFVRGRDGDALGTYVPVHANQSIRIGVGVDTARGMATVSSSPGGHVANVPWGHWDRDWIAQQGLITRAPEARQEAAALGLTIRATTTPPLHLCERVLATQLP